METALQTILDEIAAINDNGNNTAAELRRVLTDMVEYSNDGFEISIDTVVATDTQMFQYSFKGTKKQCCNLYLLVFNNTQATSTGNQTEASMFTFDIQKEDYEILRAFVPDINEDRIYLLYNLATSRIDIKAFTAIALKKTGRANELAYHVLVYTDLGPQDGIITTVPLNYIKTVFPPNLKKNEANFSKAFASMKNFK